MKYKYIFISSVILILVASLSLGISLSNKQSAIDYWQTYKADREATIDSVVDDAYSTVKFTTNEVCHIDYDTGENDYCDIGFEYDVYGKKYHSSIHILELEIFGTKVYGKDKTGYINDQIKRIIEGNIRDIIEKEDITYNNTILVNTKPK